MAKKPEQVGTFLSGNPIWRIFCPVCDTPYLASDHYQVDEWPKKRCLKCMGDEIGRLSVELEQAAQL